MLTVPSVRAPPSSYDAKVLAHPKKQDRISRAQPLPPAPNFPSEALKGALTFRGLRVDMLDMWLMVAPLALYLYLVLRVCPVARRDGPERGEPIALPCVSRDRTSHGPVSTSVSDCCEALTRSARARRIRMHRTLRRVHCISAHDHNRSADER